MRIILHPSRCPNSVLRTCALAFCRCRAASPCAFSLSGGFRRLESRFFVCAGGAPGPVRCDDVASPPSFSAAPSCRSVLPPCSAALFCRLVLRPVLPLCPAVHLTAPFCRLVLPPHRPGSAGFARTAHAVSSPSPRSGENPPAVKLRFLHDLTRAATKKRPRRGSFSSCRVSGQPQI